jgi:hypothetical protein
MKPELDSVGSKVDHVPMKLFPALTAVAIFGAACDKPGDNPAPDGTVSPSVRPQSDSRAKSGAESRREAAPVTPEEVAALVTEFEKLAKQADALKSPPADGTPPPDPDLLQDEYRMLSKRRNDFTAGMNFEQKKSLGLQLRPFVQRIGPVVMAHRIDKNQQRLKSTAPPKTQPAEAGATGTESPAPAPVPEGDELLDLLLEKPRAVPPPSNPGAVPGDPASDSPPPPQ